MAEAFDAALRRRLDIINGMGEQANAQASALASRRAQMAAEQQAQQGYMGVPQAGSIPPMGGGGGGFESFARAIAGKESGGRYSAVNRDSGALGKYQIMPGNIPSWSRQALGYSVSTSQFLRSPQLQDQIARHQLRNYYNKWGPEGAAVAWYAGPGNAKKYMASRGRGWNAAQGKYPSISAYALNILKRMGLR